MQTFTPGSRVQIETERIFVPRGKGTYISTTKLGTHVVEVRGQRSLYHPHEVKQS